FLLAKVTRTLSANELLSGTNELVASDACLLPPLETKPSHYHSRDGDNRDTPPGDTYENAALVNFVHHQTQEQMKAALREVRSQFGKKYPLTIDGEKVTTGKWMASLNPSAPNEIVGSVAEA